MGTLGSIMCAISKLLQFHYHPHYNSILCCARPHDAVIHTSIRAFWKVSKLHFKSIRMFESIPKWTDLFFKTMLTIPPSLPKGGTNMTVIEFFLFTFDNVAL